MSEHSWKELGTYRPDEAHRLVKCRSCGLMAVGIGGEYVEGEHLSTRVIFDGPHTRFVEGSPRVGPCLGPFAMGTVVYHRSTQQWITCEPEQDRTLQFVILAGERGLVVDERGTICSKSDEGSDVRLRLDPYEARDYWSVTLPKTAWDRLRELCD